MKLNEVMAKPTYRVRGRERLIKSLHEFLLAQAKEWVVKTQYGVGQSDEAKLADSYDRLTHLSLRNLIPEIKEESDKLARKAGWNRD